MLWRPLRTGVRARPSSTTLCWASVMAKRTPPLGEAGRTCGSDGEAAERCRLTAHKAGAHRHHEGKVPVEGPRDQGFRQPAHVGVGPQVVGREALQARSQGDGGRQRYSDQLQQVQVTSWTWV